MASKKFLELQDLDTDQLRNELKETETQYMKMRFDHAVKGLENPLLLTEMRRDIARIKTEIRRRDLSDMTGEQLAARSHFRKRRKKA